MSRSPRSGRFAAALAFALATVAVPSSAAVFDFEVMAYSGGPVPGVPGAVFAPYSPSGQPLYSYPTLSARGGFAFRGRLAIGVGDVTSSDDVGIWGPGADGPLTVLAREGQMLPGTPAAVCGQLFSPTAVSPALLLLNSFDQVMFGCRFLRPGSTTGVYLGIAGPRGGSASELVALESISLPGAPSPYESDSFYFLQAPVLDDLGRVTFMGAVSDTFPSIDGLWRTNGQGAVDPVVWSGLTTPGITGMRFNVLGAPSTSRNGYLAYSATATGGNPQQSTEGIWVSDGADGWQLVLRTGEAAAGVPGATYQDLDRPDVNTQRQTAFGVRLGPLADCDTLGGRCSAVYRGDPYGTETLLTRTGAAVTGPDPGAVFGTTSWEVLINDFGMVAFLGTIFVPGVTGFEEKVAVFGPAGLGVRVLARAGDQAAGLPAGVVYENLERPLLNNRGEVVFWAQLDPVVAGGYARGGLFFVDVGGVVHPILRSGDWIEVGGVSREISHVTSWTQNFNGSRRPFNDAGEFAFSVYFTDGGDAQMIGRIRRPPASCGLGAELVVLLSGVALARRSQRRARGAGIAPIDAARNRAWIGMR